MQGEHYTTQGHIAYDVSRKTLTFKNQECKNKSNIYETALLYIF